MRRPQRGVAVLTAILIVAVAASTAALMLAQQSATLDQAALVAARAQADLYARAGLDWARGVLLQDMATAASYDGLDEPWAEPIAALPVDRAIVAGAIADEQGKFNLNNLFAGGARSDADYKAFQRLLASLNLSPELADAVVDWIDPDSNLSGSGGAEDPYYLSLAKPYRTANEPMVQVEELYRVRGFDAATVQKLKPYVTALPAPAKVNINTASDVVLAALLPDVPADRIANAIAMRRTKPFRSADDIARWAGSPRDALDVKSSFFSIRIQVAQDDVNLATDALVQRGGGQVAVLWRRPVF
ncbi:MAG TPA: type II secretion system minor pseudopilin GspK [Usitatibacter sp.]|nr:type II secretion system minor pseudopilin GspK [Usitatibacter sp.]